jgi:hypothetical protein
MSVDVIYALSALACGFTAGLDSVITCYGITVDGFVEENPLYKHLPKKVSDFLLKSAFGAFLFGGAKLIGTGFLAMVLAHHGFYNTLGSFVFWVPAAGLTGVNIHNLLLMRKLKAVKK